MSEYITRIEAKAMASYLTGQDSEDRDDIIFVYADITGNDEYAEVLRLSITENNGEVLCDILLKPKTKVSPTIVARTGFTKEVLKDKPDWSDYGENLKELLENKIIVGWNTERLIDVIEWTSKRANSSVRIRGTSTVIDAMEIAQNFFRVNQIPLTINEVTDACMIVRLDPEEEAYGAINIINILKKISKPGNNVDKIEDWVADRKREQILEIRRTEIASRQIKEELSSPEDIQKEPAWVKYVNLMKKGNSIEKIAEETKTKEETVLVNIYKAMNAGMIEFRNLSKGGDQEEARKIVDSIKAKTFKSFSYQVSQEDTYKKVRRKCREKGVDFPMIFEEAIKKYNPGIKEGDTIENPEIFG